MEEGDRPIMDYCDYRGGILVRDSVKVIVTALVHEEYKPVVRLDCGRDYAEGK